MLSVFEGQSPGRLGGREKEGGQVCREVRFDSGWEDFGMHTKGSESHGGGL